jgi:SAM-dependent methyltransferase
VARDAFWELERAGWDRASARYEECWSDTSVFVEALLDDAVVTAGTRLLDIACGPGIVSRAAAERGAVPTGVDVAPGMVEQARSRRPDLEFVEGDALALPFADASFGAVTMNFGILHLSDPDTAVAEAARVLAPGGRFAFTAWLEEGNAVAEIVSAAVDAHAAPVELPEGPPFFRFADAEECRRVLEAAGLDGGTFRTETITHDWQVPTAELLFEAEFDAGVRTAAVLRAQSPERQEAIAQAMADGVRRHADGDRFVLPIVARVASAAR